MPDICPRCSKLNDGPHTCLSPRYLGEIEEILGASGQAVVERVRRLVQFAESIEGPIEEEPGLCYCVQDNCPSRAVQFIGDVHHSTDCPWLHAQKVLGKQPEAGGVE